MRPQSINNFSRFYLGAVAVWLINLVTGWNRAMGIMQQNPQFRAQPEMMQIVPVLMGGMSALVLFLSLLMWWLVTYKRSSVAKWILVVFYAVATLSLPLSLMSWQVNGALATGLVVIGWLLQTAAIVMLFRKDSNEWFGVSDNDEPEGPLVPPSTTE